MINGYIIQVRSHTPALLQSLLLQATREWNIYTATDVSNFPKKQFSCCSPTASTMLRNYKQDQ